MVETDAPGSPPLRERRLRLARIDVIYLRNLPRPKCSMPEREQRCLRSCCHECGREEDENHQHCGRDEGDGAQPCPGKWPEARRSVPELGPRASDAAASHQALLKVIYRAGACRPVTRV